MPGTSSSQAVYQAKPIQHMNQIRQRLGIEIGGTKLQLGVGDGTSPRLDALVRCSVDVAQGAAGIRAAIAREVPALLASHAIESIGIGFGGPVQGGVVTKSHQIAGWEQFPLAAWCREQFSLPVAVGNDCDAAALAEASLGAGRSSHTVFYVTVGTGVGGGLVIGRRPHGSERPAVAEIGHLRPGPAAVNSDETVESQSSGWGIAAQARRRLTAAANDQEQARAVSQLDALCGGDRARLTAVHVAEAAAAGNGLAAAALQESVNVLGWAIAQVVTLVAPETVVVGGGVSLMGERLFFGPLRAAVARYVFPPLAESYQIVPAALGEDVVVVGALLLGAAAA